VTDLIRIATRKSPLAVWQAEHVAAALRRVHDGLRVELVPMSTKGDKLLDAPLAKIGGKGLFVKELEHALLEGRADIAVHSMKDVPVDFPDGLHLPVIMEREDPRDAFVSQRYATLDVLPTGAAVGTSSLRRRCQLLGLRPDLKILDLRGNVNTRLGKLDGGDFDAIVLAAAGLRRLGMGDRIAESLAPEALLPAIGQGAIGIECRQHDVAVESCIAPLNHGLTAARVAAERAMNHTLSGGCQVPVAGFAEESDGQLHLRGLVGSLDGQTVLREEATAPVAQAQTMGRDVAEALLARGAAAILEEIRADGQ